MIYNNENKNEEESDDGIYFYPDDADSDEIGTDDMGSDDSDNDNNGSNNIEDDNIEDNNKEFDVIDTNSNNSRYSNSAKIDTVYGSQRYSDSNYGQDGVKHKKNNNSGGTTIMSEILSYIKIILCAVAIAFIFTQFIIVNAQVPTGSMTDTINIGDRLIGFRLSYLFSDPQRGDIVIFKYPDDETQNYVKRVIGTPGDVIQIKDGQVIVNGEVLEEDYLLEAMIPREEEEVYVVPDNCYFMMGDNRNNSLDSRYWTNTYVSKDKILAKVIFRYYNGDTKRVGFSLVK